MEICEKYLCTGCAACVAVCPAKCITMRPNELSALLPFIDDEKCINCNLCKKKCPNNNPLPFLYPMRAYAAWSKDDEQHRTSASGGVASEMYKSILRKGGVGAGVTYDRILGAHFIEIKSKEDVNACKNSKYVYSDAHGIYNLLKEKIRNGHNVLFIGLPCQVAALKSIMGKPYDNLITVDLICHGIAPAEFLNQHITAIEKKKGQHAQKVLFRDPYTYTYTFTLSTLNPDGNRFYSKTVRSFDNYQLGYHHALIYRDNCYKCCYARPERISDLTIGDFSGYGRLAVKGSDTKERNCVLVNTQKGQDFLDSLLDCLVIEERPIDEALRYEIQLQHPSKPHKNRHVFCELYSKSKDFEKSCNRSL